MRFETRRHRRRRQLLQGGFPPAWRALLDERVPHARLLDGDERERLERLTLGLVATKRWEAARGFELTDEIVVTVAGLAALLVLGLPDDSYRDVQAIVVHPTTLVLTGERSQVPGLVSDGPMPILGQASQTGPVVIVWDAVLDEVRRPGRGHNVVFHEFAHKLDLLDGLIDGTPPLATDEQLQRWVAVCTDVYEQLQRGEAGAVLRSYAGVNPGEFFAVATEAFFDDPVGLRHEHPDLYGVLAAFYRQDPAVRVPPPT